MRPEVGAAANERAATSQPPPLGHATARATRRFLVDFFAQHVPRITSTIFRRSRKTRLTMLPLDSSCGIMLFG